MLLAAGRPAAQTGQRAPPGPRDPEVMRMVESVQAARAGGPPPAWDEGLALAARRHAEELERRGVLDHTGLDGERVASRARRAGVTESELGEILGSGPDVRAVVDAWLTSQAHRAVLRDRRWTHVGVGRGPLGRVWVVVFCARRVADLEVVYADGSVAVGGRLMAADAARPVLLVDLSWHEAVTWRSSDGWFRFELGRFEPGSSYVRLGYVTIDGQLRITNVLSRPRE